MRRRLRRKMNVAMMRRMTELITTRLLIKVSMITCVFMGGCNNILLWPNCSMILYYCS